MPIADDYIDHLRDAENFLSNRQLRRKFMSLLPEPLRHLFQHYSTVHIDWKWEFLDNYNTEQLLAKASGEKANNETVTKCGATMQKPFFAEFSEMIRMHGKCIEEVAHTLGRFCHKVLSSGDTYVMKFLSTQGAARPSWRGMHYHAPPITPVRPLR